MKGLVRLICMVTVAIPLLTVSCSKDKPTGTLSFDVSAAYLQPGGSQTVGFSTSANITSCTISGYPEGWTEPLLDLEKKTVTIIAPAIFEDETVTSGTVILSGAPSGGVMETASLFVCVAEGVALDDAQQGRGPANSYIVNRPDTYYTFDALHKGDGTSPLATASVKEIWMTSSSLLRYIQLVDGRVSFYVGTGDDDQLAEGNAVIGAYDRNGSLLWSWHIWVTDYDPEAAEGSVDFNGYTMMTRNLGAQAAENDSSDDILASYGLYYQWGRKDPFIGPATYRANQGTAATMYLSTGTRVTLNTEASNDETGTMAYAVKHPTTFLLTDGPDKDWLQGGSQALWADRKTVNDPCPYGWQVPPTAAFDGLSIVEDKAAADAATLYYDKYGWTLEKAGASAWFIGAGYRNYYDGKISNIYDNLPVASAASRNNAIYMQPWVGYYWTTNAPQSGVASAFYFWFDKSDPASSGVIADQPTGRSNGLQVRCVRTRQ